LGAEFSFEYQWTPQLKAVFLLPMVNTHMIVILIYVNNDALATVENTNPSFDFGKLLKNYKQAGMPQQAYALGSSTEILNTGGLELT
jgi:hypothetical protein